MYRQHKGNYNNSNNYNAKRQGKRIDDIFEKSLATNKKQVETFENNNFENEQNFSHEKKYEKSNNEKYEKFYNQSNTKNYHYPQNNYVYSYNQFPEENLENSYKKSKQNKFSSNYNQPNKFESNQNFENKQTDDLIDYNDYNNFEESSSYQQKDKNSQLDNTKTDENKDNYYYSNEDHNYYKNNDPYYNDFNQYQKPKKSRKKAKTKLSQPTALEKIRLQKSIIDNLVSTITNKAPELTYNLINELIESEYECMICNDIISQSEETWSCDKCHTIYHIKCIYDWIFKLNSENPDEKSKKKITSIFKWSCPHCNCNYTATTENLPKYNCYCKRYYKAEEGFKKNLEEYKNFNPELVPHGCGLTCNRKICSHLTCNLPCHPGPHLICNKIEVLNCYCGHTKKEIPCSSLSTTNNRKFICQKICDKQLNCKRHKCKAVCHEGDCESLFRMRKCEECTIEAKNKFMNFLNSLENKIKTDFKREVKLAEDLADYIFHGLLLCKSHYVEANTDENLKFLLKLIQISGNSLLENIKKFIPICKEVVQNSCFCKAKSSKTECYKINYKEDILNFLSISEQKEKTLNQCNKVCKALKSCKIHTCDRICCELANVKITNYSLEDPNGLHLCLNICGKDLNCGKHKCENYCHRGNCLPCKNIIREGESFCSCGTTVLKAPFICGSTPQCKMPCIKPRDCPHPCTKMCHDGYCPPCDEFVIKACNCQKTLIENVKCGSEKPPTCNKICEEMLPCGAHFCDLTCHYHTKEYDEKYFCNLQCGRSFRFCKHTCKKRCHGEDDCWELECDVKTKVFCQCKVFSKDLKCGELKKKTENLTNEFFIPCNDECKRIERLKKIEIAFDGLFKYNQEKNKQLLKGLGEAKNKEGTRAKGTQSKGPIVRNMGKKEEQEQNNNEGNTNDVDNFERNNENSEKGDNDEYNNEHEEYIKRFCDVKFSYRNIAFATENINFVIEIENAVEKALKNQTEKHEINNLDKKEYIFASEFLRTYYNIDSEKIKKNNDLNYHIILKNCHDAKIPRIKISLLALLFKSHKFVNIPSKQENNSITINKNKIIFHPFESSIYIQDYRLQVTPEVVDNYISNIVATDKYYVNEIHSGKCYVHFFDKYNCKKVFNDLRNKPSQFQDCYEVFYYHEDDWRYEDFYLYLRNDEYFKYLNDFDQNNNQELIFEVISKEKIEIGQNPQNAEKLYEKISENSDDNIKSKNEGIKDDDGFFVVTKKKKK